jgi:hypothetical protein
MPSFRWPMQRFEAARFRRCRVRETGIGGPLLIISAAAFAFQIQAAEWHIDASARLFFESNVNHAAFSPDVLDDFAFAPQASVGKYYQLTDDDGLSVAANARGAIYGQYDGLNHVYGGGAFALRHKFGLGAYAPWLRLHGTAGYAEYDSALRDGGLYAAGVRLGRRFSSRLDAWIDYTFDYRDGPNSPASTPGKSGDVFTLAGHQLSIRSNLLLTDRLMMSAGYGVRFGDVYANRSPVVGWRWRRAAGAVDAQTRDDAFPGFSYRIDSATTHSFALEASYALDGHSSVNLGYEFQWAEGSGLAYANHIPQLSFVYGF